MSRIAALVESALKNAWVFEDLPWHLPVDPERESFPGESFFASGLPAFQKMSAPQRRAFVFRETCFHLSNLLAGEHTGEQLVAQVMVLTARERPTDREFLAVMAQEEAKHFLALQRYLSEKAGVLYPPCRRLRSALRSIEELRDYQKEPASLEFPDLVVNFHHFVQTAASLVAGVVADATAFTLLNLYRFDFLRREAGIN